MSMFYELLMKAKEVYAQVFGTLTESPKGVFSGFSDANYLLIEQGTPDDMTELLVEFTTPSTIPGSGTQTIVNMGIFSLSLYNKLITLYGGSGGQTVIPKDALVGGSTYVIRAVRNTGKSFTFYYSKDGGDFIETTTWVSNMSWGTLIRIGSSTNTGRGWKGSINVGNTRITRASGVWYKGKVKW